MMKRSTLTSLRILPFVLAIGCAPQLTVGEKDLPSGQAGDDSYQDGKDELGQGGKAPGIAGIFSCADGKTQIPSSLVCNGKPECPNDASDEKGCPSTPFYCKDGSDKLEQLQVCNGKPDCKDGSDELDCPAPVFKCKDGHELDYKLVCDGKQDCKDSTDEIGCTLFYCKDGSDKFDPSLVCNDHPDCKDGSDEVGCPLFSCKDGSNKVDKKLVCDGVTNCKDGSDEVDCPSVFYCKDGSAKVEKEQVCNEKQDCKDGSDEVVCPGKLIQPLFVCVADKVRLDGSLACDGKLDCKDGSDEVDCDLPDFKCRDGLILPHNQVCNGILECTGHDDEVNCVDGEPEACSNGVAHGSQVDLEKGCLMAWGPMDCLDMGPDDKLLPTLWADGDICLRRKSDGAVFSINQRSLNDEWEDCSPDESKLAHSNPCQ
jgi:hypothetical protein